MLSFSGSSAEIRIEADQGRKALQSATAGKGFHAKLVGTGIAGKLPQAVRANRCPDLVDSTGVLLARGCDCIDTHRKSAPC
jgi:hypothetical protein